MSTQSLPNIFFLIWGGEGPGMYLLMVQSPSILNSHDIF